MSKQIFKPLFLNTSKKIFIKTGIKLIIKIIFVLIIIIALINATIAALFYYRFFTAQSLADTLAITSPLLTKPLVLLDEYVQSQNIVKAPAVTIEQTSKNEVATNNSVLIVDTDNLASADNKNTILQNSNQLKPKQADNTKDIAANKDIARRVSKLSRLYTAMSPEEAAAIIKRLDDDTVILILNKMEEDQAAKILSKLDAQYVAKISQKMIKGK